MHPRLLWVHVLQPREYRWDQSAELAFRSTGSPWPPVSRGDGYNAHARVARQANVALSVVCVMGTPSADLSCVGHVATGNWWGVHRAWRSTHLRKAVVELDGKEATA